MVDPNARVCVCVYNFQAHSDMGGGKKKKQSQGRGGGQKGQPLKAEKSKGSAEVPTEDLPDPVEDLVEDAEQLEETEREGSTSQDPELSTEQSKGKSPFTHSVR